MTAGKVALRILGVVSVFPVLIRSTLLLVPGGTVIVQEAVNINADPSLPITRQEPVFIAIIPLVFSLIIIVGFIKEYFPLLWLGGVGLLITGVLFIFSLGIYISIAGLIALILSFILFKLGYTKER